MSKIAFIGLGIMGNPMAGHLARAGHEVIGYNRSPKYAELEAAGGRGADSLAEAVADAEIIAIMVPDSADVAAVLHGADGAAGVFASATPGALIIDFSSIRPDVSAELAKEAVEKGFRIIDAPVSGGEAGAKAATLSIMCGGAEDHFEAAQPVLDVVGKTVVRVGPAGAGQTVKAANQLMVAVNIQALAEAVLFLEAYGVDLGPALQVLGGGLAGSAVQQQKAGKMRDREFAPGFRIALHHKDLGIVTSAAREVGVVLPLGAAVAQLMASALANGDGGLDHSALLRGVERLSGRETAN